MVVTLDDVAAGSGVSRSTASRALSGDARVKAATRSRVQAVAKDLGYSPNQAARNLASGRTGTVALVVPETNLLENPWVALVITGVCRAARRSGRSVTLWMDALSTERAPEVVRHGGADGLVIMASAFSREWISDVNTTRLPTVLVGEHDELPDAITVGSDNDEGGRLVARHLHELGHRKVAVLAGPQERPDARERLSSFLAEMALLDSPVPHYLVAEGDFSVGSGLSGLTSIIDEQPTAIFAANDLMAAGVLRGLRLAGKSAPNDVSVVGFDNLPIGKDLEPPLTTVNQDPLAMGEEAIRLMDRMIDGEPVESAVIPVKLITRRSTMPINVPLD